MRLTAGFLLACLSTTLPDAAHSDFITDQATRTPVEVAHLETAGTWQSDGESGFFRVIVSLEDVISGSDQTTRTSLAIQKVIVPVKGALAIKTTIPIPEIAALNLANAAIEVYAEKENEVTVRVVVVTDDGSETAAQLVSMQQDGSYKVAPEPAGALPQSKPDAPPSAK